MLDFPSSPTNGQKFTNGNAVYTYSTAIGAWSAAPLGTAEARNRLVNGTMQTSLENGTTALAVTTGGYPLDQWQIQGNIATVTAVWQPTTTPNGNGRFYTQIVTAKPSLAATDYWQIVQFVEGKRVADFRWGTAQAKPAVLRFWAWSTVAGNYSFRLNNGGATRQFMAAYTLPAATWTEVVIPIPGDTVVDTWPTDNTRGMILGWSLAAGSTYSGATPGWAAAAGKQQIAGHLNLAATASAQFFLADVGLFLDPAGTGRAPPLEAVPLMRNQMDALRYWHDTFGHRGVANTTTNGGRTGLAHPVEMRIGPAAALDGTVLCYDGTANNAISAFASTYPNVRYSEVNMTTTGLTVGRGVIQNQSAPNRITLNARM